jgi:hypothetical protein
MVDCYRRSGTTHRSYLPRIMQSFLDCFALENGAARLAETSVRNYHSTLRRVPKERRYNAHRGGNLKSRTFHEPPPTKKSSTIKLWEPVSCKQCVRSTSHDVSEGRTPSFASLSVVQKQNFRAYQGKRLPLWWPEKKSGRDVIWESPHYSQCHVEFFIFLKIFITSTKG